MSEHEETYPEHTPEDNRTRAYEGRHCTVCKTHTVHKREREEDLWECQNPAHFQPQDDPIKRPKHYTKGGVEVWDAIEAWGLDYFRGNVVKYVARAGKKDPEKEREDLEKARAYLDRAIHRL